VVTTKAQTLPLELRDALVIILAGGEGKRLYPLTLDRCKPAVPFGGRYRIVDIVLSNILNSGLHRMIVLTQFKSQSLIRHIQRGWEMPSWAGQYVEIVPAQMRKGPHWYKGSADAIYQNLEILAPEPGEVVCVFGSDHVYKMDVTQMMVAHLETGAECTVSSMPVPREEATQYGVMHVDETGRIIDFMEKPADPPPMPGDPTKALVSMGNYVFSRKPLERAVSADAEDETSANDLGKNIVPMFVERGTAYAYSFADNTIPGEANEGDEPYWRDVGTVDAYYEASMDLVSVSPQFDLYNPHWPLYTLSETVGPAKFVFADDESDRVGIATDSIVCEGCIVSGGHVDRSILSPRVRINSYAEVEQSVLCHGVDVGRHSRVRRAVIDKGVRIPSGTRIGYNEEEDRKRFTVTESGIVVVRKGTKL